MTSNFHFFRYKYIFIVFHFNLISRVDDIYCYSAAAAAIPILSILLTIHFPGSVWYTFSDKYEIKKIVFMIRETNIFYFCFFEEFFYHLFIANLSGPRVMMRVNLIFNFLQESLLSAASEVSAINSVFYSNLFHVQHKSILSKHWP